MAAHLSFKLELTQEEYKEFKRACFTKYPPGARDDSYWESNPTEAPVNKVLSELIKGFTAGSSADLAAVRIREPDTPPFGHDL